MENLIRLFVSMLLLGWSTAAFAGDWYVHRTSHVMKVPPWYCYCYRATTANVIPATPAHPMDMQISRAQAFSKLAVYAAQPETCPGNCQAGSQTSDNEPQHRPPPLKPAKAPSEQCKLLAKVGGCMGFCKSFAAGYDVADSAIAQCITDCNVRKVTEFGCAP